MSGSGKEGAIRQKIIEDDLIDCMVALPTNLFYTVTIPACLWFVTKNKDDGKSRKRKGETLFIDARKIFTQVDRAHNELSEEQIQKIASTYRSFIGEKGYPKYKDVPGYCQVSKIEYMQLVTFPCQHHQNLTKATLDFLILIFPFGTKQSTNKSGILGPQQT